MTPDLAAYNAIHALAPAYPDVAPDSAPLPRIVYQQVGGRAINYLESTIPDAENGRIQIACWAKTRGAAVTLAQQVEDAMRQAPGMQCEVLGARVSVHEPDTGLYGCRQDFSVWAQR